MDAEQQRFMSPQLPLLFHETLPAGEDVDVDVDANAASFLKVHPQPPLASTSTNATASGPAADPYSVVAAAYVSTQKNYKLSQGQSKI